MEWPADWIELIQCALLEKGAEAVNEAEHAVARVPLGRRGLIEAQVTFPLDVRKPRETGMSCPRFEPLGAVGERTLDRGLRFMRRGRRPILLRLLPLLALLLLLALAGLLGRNGIGSAVLPLPETSIRRAVTGVLVAVGGPRRLVLVVDASASMSEPLPGGDASGSKWDVVRRGVTAFLHSLPAETVVGVRVLGRGTSTCADAEQLRQAIPLGAAGAEGIGARLDRIHPAGDTPLAQAITAAADDLGASGGEIVVLSDAEDTCAGLDELCAAARSVAARGARVRIDIVQTFVADEARRAIACVPEATGGLMVNLAGGDALALTWVLLRLGPMRLPAAILLIAFGGLTLFYLCDLLASALGAIVVRGTAGFVADMVFAIGASLWTAFWLTRSSHLPFLPAAFLGAVLVAVLFRGILQRRSEGRSLAGGEWS